MIQGYCEQCGKFFSRNRGKKRDAGKFCSRECSFAFATARKNERLQAGVKSVSRKISTERCFVCECCGKNFYSIRKRKYCTKECQLNINRRKCKVRRHKEYIEKYVSKKSICAFCGKTFMTAYKKSKKFCSESCREKAEKKWKRSHKDRLLGKIINSDITLEKLIIRDKGVCALCGFPIDLDDYSKVDGNFIVGEKYPSIDHIIPLSLGGVHSWENIQLAHWKCNCLKGNNINFKLSP